VTDPADRTARDEIAAALSDLGADVETSGDAVHVDGIALTLPLVVRAHPHPAELERLVETEPGPALVVADRISDAGREVLRAAGWSWLDRRGHMRLWQRGVRVDAAFAADRGDLDGRSRNVWTTVGLEVVLHAMCHADDVVSPRRVAADIGRSTGSVHELIARLIELGLVGPSTRKPLMPDLFWETVARWPDDDWVALAAPITAVAERLGEPELVRVDERAATLGGARIAAAGNLVPRCYVRDNAALRRVRSLADKSQPAQCFVRVAPIRWLPVVDELEPTSEHPWRIAHPMVCALRLAGDPSRGREIVQAWGIVPGNPS
jgi:hypothetical protein